MPIWLYLIMMALSGYRLTVLVVQDTFPPVLWLRDRVVGGWRPVTAKEWEQIRAAAQDGAAKTFTTQAVDFGGKRGEQEARYVERASWVPFWLSDLVSCPWCASGWISLALAAAGAAQGFYGWPVSWLVWGAVWAVSATMAAWEVSR
jgi:hypothetical protein